MSAETRAQLQERYWGTTNDLLGIRTEPNQKASAIVQKLGTQVLDIKNYSATHRPTEALFEELHALALSTLCALSVGNTNPDLALPGIRVAITSFKPGEEYHPLSTNPVEIFIPRLNNEDAVSLKTTLDHLASHLEVAADFTNDSRHAAVLVKSLGPEIKQEPEDDFIIRRAHEAFKAGKTAQAIPQNASPEEKMRVRLLIDTKQRLSEELMFLWLERRLRGDVNKAGGVDFQIGLLNDEEGNGNDFLEIAVRQPGSNTRTAFVFLPPWRVYQPKDSTRSLMNTLTAIGGRNSFDYQKSRSTLPRR